MCYDDDASGPVVMSAVCPSEHEALLDCGDNDYFNTDPAAGNYLATHWNTANSSCLQNVTAPRQALLGLTGTATITYGQRVTLPSRLTDEQTAAGIAGEQVNLFSRRAGTAGDQAPVPPPPTPRAPPGSPSPRWPPPPTGQLPRLPDPRHRRQPAGDHHRHPNGQRRLKASTITLGQTITVTGTVAPNHRGQRVYLQRLVNGSWKGATATLSNGHPEQRQQLHPAGQAPGPGQVDPPGREACRHRPHQRDQRDAEGDRSLRDGGPPR